MASLEPRELEELSRFLADRGKETLFDYLELAPDADESATDEAISTRRRWAQGQQANPKFRAEALWVIKNSKLIKRVLGEARPAYLRALAKSSANAAIEALGPFIQGILATGSLSPQAEEAIRARGAELGLDAEQIAAETESWLERTGAGREQPQGSAKAVFNDWYALLDVPDTAAVEIIEQAYRRKYRWARQLRDPQRANKLYAALDEAWRVLKTPALRDKYDQERQRALQDGVAASSPELELSVGDEPVIMAFRDQEPAASPSAAATEEPSKEPAALRFPEPPPQPEAPVAEDPERRLRAAPRLPETLVNAALEVTGGARPRRRDQAGPKLEVVGPTERQIKVGRKPVQVQITVRNVGEGQLQGTVHADRDWVELSPSTLDPNRRQQDITVTVHPQRMPRRQAVCYVGISANRGQRASVTLEVKRADTRPLWLAAALVLLFLGGLAAAMSGLFGAGEPSPPQLKVEVDPPGAEIWVNDHMESSNGQLVLSEDLPPNTPLSVRVQLDGFESWTQTVSIPPGQTLNLRPTLALTDPMAMTNVPSAGRGEIDMDGVKAVLQERRARLEGCLARHATSSEPGTTLGLRFRVRVTSTGTAAGYEADEREGVDEAVDTCVKRELRAIRYPLVAGEYGEFSYGLKGKIPEGTDGAP